MYTKVCKICRTEKEISLFQKDISKKDLLRPECKECTSKARKSRYCANKVRKQNLEKNFGKGALDKYKELYLKQNGLCAICGTEENGRYKNLSIDHCHDTGIIRGLLCNNCNRGIGLLKDSPELMRKAADYVEEF